MTDEQCRSIVRFQSITDISSEVLIVQRFAERVGRALQYFVEDCIDSISIRCPRESCRVLLDLNPDACAAISCGNCGQNLCTCCLCRFTSSQQAHVHVPLAHAWRDVFLPREMVLAGQQRLRIVQLGDYLHKFKCESVIDEFFVVAAAELVDLGLPLNWTELQVAHEAAKIVLNQERLGASIQNNADEDADGIGAEPFRVEEELASPAVLLGRRLLALCFERRFDELRILHHESLANNQQWDVDWFQRSPDGNIAFNVAARLSGDGFLRIACMQVVLGLGAGGTINAIDSDGFSALHRFVLLNDVQCLKFLLQQEGISTEVETREGRTALFLCAEARHIHIARELLRHGAYLHTTSDTGQTVLMALSMRCQLDAITPGELVRNLTFWLDAGADVEVPDGQSAWKALHYAACGRFDNGAVAIRTLLRCGAQVSSKNRFGQSPLHVAVCFANLDGIRALVAAEGANPSIPFDSSEEFLLNADHEARREEIVAVLKQAQAWERRKIELLDSARGVWKEYGAYVGVAVGMGLIALLLKPMQSFFARLQQKRL